MRASEIACENAYKTGKNVPGFDFGRRLRLWQTTLLFGAIIFITRKFDDFHKIDWIPGDLPKFLVGIFQIIIQGFKSYREQTVVEPFDKRHNVVVGEFFRVDF